MHVSPARFVSIVGTEVLATPTSKPEAKIALKELRQKKKEFQLRRRALMAQAKAAREAQARAEARPQRKKSGGFFAMVRKLFGKVKARKPKRQLAEIEAEIQATDEILYNLDSCTVQIEGRLLQMG
jgi:hypothetical protein